MTPIPMRLMIVSSEFPPGPGGIGTHAYQVARLMSFRGHQVSVLTPQDFVDTSEIRAFNPDQPFKIVRFRPLPLPPLKAGYRAALVARELGSFKPDGILATGQRAVWLTAAMAGRAEIPWVAVGHGTEFGSRATWIRNVTRWSFERASAVVCVSQYTHDQMLSLGVTAHRSVVIHNGADAARFTVRPDDEVRSEQRRLGLEGKRLIITVGRVSERKGQDVVIRALPNVHRHIPNAHYLIVGMPVWQRSFETLAERLGVASYVHFLGRVDDDSVVRLLNCSDIFAMTSRRTDNGDFEGYGIAVAEAALCGKPAVVSTDSGLAEAIVDGKTGLGVPENDPDATASALVRLLSDSEERATMGRMARERALEKQTWEQVVSKYDALLREVCSG